MPSRRCYYFLLATAAILVVTGCDVAAPVEATATVEVPVEVGEIGPRLHRVTDASWTPPPGSDSLQHGHRMEVHGGWYIIWADLEAGRYKLSCEAEPFQLVEDETRRASC